MPSVQRRHYNVMCPELKQVVSTGSKLITKLLKNSNEKFHTLANPTCSADVLLQKLLVVYLYAISGSWTKEIEKKKGIFLSDKEACPDDSASSVHLLIGVDIAGKLLLEKFVNLSCGLVAMETLLGWSLMGKLEMK
ncbi:hypothetical protein CEXT_361981 [Caerostris extrusa]|uniref:Uncharacterized protein n=1 Tax=Caerostris extrusa TaxID=172846 RepID=A0AAV4XY55_CAEEX|nr:hypothetical protein CEXT_361981 [Caerostris extrusa]